MDTIEKMQQGDQELRLLRSTKQSILNGLLADLIAKTKRDLLVAQGAEADAKIALKNASTPPSVDSATCTLQTAQGVVADLQGQLRCLES
jgi:hypothetical protein